MRKAVFCVARDRDQAVQIVDQLRLSGFSPADISIAMTDPSAADQVAIENATKAPEGAATGAGAGLLAGGALGWLVGIGALAIPGVGPLIAAGPIMAALSAAAVGSAVGGVGGGLIGLGISEYEAKRYESQLQAGNALVSVRAETDAQERRAREIFEAAGAEDISTQNVSDSGDSSETRLHDDDNLPPSRPR